MIGRVVAAGLPRSFGWGLAVLSLVLALVLNHPIGAYTDYKLAQSHTSARLTAEIAALRAKRAPQQIEISNPKNLVLIYLEGLEQTFFDTELFPGLLPKIAQLRTEAVSFTNMHQFPGTSWTIAGIVSSQCGIPLLHRRGHLANNRVLVEQDNPFKDVTCAAEVLKQAGYVTQYLGGASLEFAGKGQFLRDNGYDSALGIDEIPQPVRTGWGMYDEDLFAIGRTIFDGLSQGEAPFLLSMLTLDTHHPKGKPSPFCEAYNAPDPELLQAVHCADRLVTEFVRYVQASPIADQTVIVVMSDHLTMSAPMQTEFGSAPRRLLFFLLDPSRPADVYSGMGSHFDVAPTLLEAVGVTGAEFAFGQSLLSNPQGRVADRALTQEDLNGFYIEALTADEVE